jgi:hypothetical protein
LVVRGFSQLRYSMVVIGWWLTVLALAAGGKWMALALVALLPLVFLIVRRRSLRLGLYSLATWNMIAIGFLQGLVRPRRAPSDTIAFRDLSAADGQGHAM